MFQRTMGLVGVATLVLAAFTTGCALQGVPGEGPLTSEARAADGFTRIDVSHGINLAVRIGAVRSVEVQAQANLLPIIATEVSGDTIRIYGTKEFVASKPAVVTIVLPSLDAVSLSGGSQGTVDGLSTDDFGVELLGGAGLTATGTAATVAIEGAGGSHVDLHGLAARAVVVDIAGGVEATVQASESVSGDASGGARVTVIGDARLNVDTNGGAEVTRR
jgi:hypothetical protein